MLKKESYAETAVFHIFSTEHEEDYIRACVTVCNGCLYVRVTCVCTGLRAYVSVVQLQQTGVNRTYVASGLASNVT